MVPESFYRSKQVKQNNKTKQNKAKQNKQNKAKQTKYFFKTNKEQYNYYNSKQNKQE